MSPLYYENGKRYHLSEAEIKKKLFDIILQKMLNIKSLAVVLIAYPNVSSQLL